ncbi:phage tail assembly protein [Enterovibrio norvegicus]|uniref:phage tail assembly protein n=1 Tax=Enterovibrio norvegicus TaxID=188144 RepID=UPI000C8630C6|nr:phage tail assembly protein [Enterovibrio norvegicus]PMN73145.1 hypothetical protein BCT27_12430 [Enterovibrio norvegicus]
MTQTTKNVTLFKPLTRGDTQITAIELREPNTGALRGLELFSVLRMDVTALRTLVPRISTVTANEFDQLGPKDLAIVANEVASFFME